MKINYRKNFDTDGFVYNQTITINSEIRKKFNKYIYNLKQKTTKKIILNTDDMKILYNLDFLKNNINYTTLTTLKHFKDFYLKEIYTPPKKDINFERIKLRNTIIQLKED